MKSRTFTFVTSFFLLIISSELSSVNAQIAPDEIRKTMKGLDKNFGAYYWTAYPTEIWGVGSVMSDDDKEGSDAFKDPKYQLIPGWRFFGQKEKPSTPDKMINLSGEYLYINDGPSINAERKTISDTALKATLPLIGNLLGISGDFSKLRNTEVRLNFAKLKIRSLNKVLVKGNYSAGWEGVNRTSRKDALEGGEHVAALFFEG